MQKFPYGLIPPPMILSQCVTLLGLYHHAAFRAAWPYLVPAHVCFYMTHMVQEHFDIHAKAAKALYKMSFTPPIKLTLTKYEQLAGNYFKSNNASPMIDFRAFSSIMREQLNIYIQRRLGELICSLLEDSQQKAIHLFAFTLLIQELNKFVAADGAGFGGQDREKGVPPCALHRTEDSSIIKGTKARLIRRK